MQNPQEDKTTLTNFNDELLELLCQDNNNNNNENICLISNTALKENYVKLCCGHTFNYTAIFNEIKYQKTQMHHYETQIL
jgi:hypothetical protein